MILEMGSSYSILHTKRVVGWNFRTISWADGNFVSSPRLVGNRGKNKPEQDTQCTTRVNQT
jgi:hypothetical protein